MCRIRNQELRNSIEFLVDIIDTSTIEERISIANELAELDRKLKSNGAKELIKDLENYARYGFIEVEIKQKPTSGATEISK